MRKLGAFFILTIGLIGSSLSYGDALSQGGIVSIDDIHSALELKNQLNLYGCDQFDNTVRKAYHDVYLNVAALIREMENVVRSRRYQRLLTAQFQQVQKDLMCIQETIRLGAVECKKNGVERGPSCEGAFAFTNASSHVALCIENLFPSHERSTYDFTELRRSIIHEYSHWCGSKDEWKFSGRPIDPNLYEELFEHGFNLDLFNIR